MDKPKPSFVETNYTETAHDQQLVQAIKDKFDAIVVEQPARPLFTNEFNLVKRPSLNPQLSSQVQQRSKISGLISQIINIEPCKQLRSIYRKIKNTKIRQKFQPKKLAKGSIFTDPKAFVNQLKFDGSSKCKRSYRKAYSTVLEATAAIMGEAKPLQSKYCVDNYLFSQISVSGLASRKFNSVKSKRKVQIIPTKTTDCKDYPCSPRMSLSVENVNRRRPSRPKKYSLQRQYQQTFLLDNQSNLDSYLNNFSKLKKNRSAIYNTRMEDIKKITRLVTEQGLQNMDFYDDLIQQSKKRHHTET